MAAAVSAAAAAAAAPLASTYLAKYSNEEDILNGEYASLYDRYNMGTQAQVLSSLAIKSSAVIPKVYLYLSKVNGKPVIAAFHRPSVYEAHPITITEWDGEAFCFRGDVMPGNHIPMFKFPDQAFERTELQRVPTMAATDGLVGAMPRNVHYIPAPADGAADTELIRTRMVIQVPHAYIHIVLKLQASPRQYWQELAGAIRNDGREASLAPLLNWLRMALTASIEEEDEDDDVDPLNMLGDRNDVFPPLAIDDEGLQAHRWKVLCGDLPGLNPPNPVNDADRFMALVSAMRMDSQRERAAAAAEREQAKAPKVPSEVFPLVHTRWMSIAGVADEELLPNIFQQWSNCTKAERRPALQAAFDQRAAESNAATNLSPIATKEVYEMVLQGRVGPQVHQLSDLTVGVSPFTCGFFVGQKDTPVAIRTEQ